jgi:hypothetical protein
MLAVRNPHLLIAVILSTSGLLVLVNGAMGTNGNPVLTAGLMFLPGFALFALGNFRGVTLNVIDVLFLAFVGCIALSMLANGYPPTKEMVFLGLSLFAYPACRFIRLGESARSFRLVTSAIVVAGSIVTAAALVSQWDYLDHPKVFGFFHAATVFLTSVGFLVIFHASTKGDWKSLLWLSVPVAIFAACMVRFTFVAIIAGLMVAATTSIDRKRVLGIAAMVCIAAVIGFAVRYKATEIHLVQNVAKSFTAPAAAPAAQSTPLVTVPADGRTCPDSNTITMRRTLLRDAIAAIPTAGAFGHGLGWSENATCLKSAPHNSFLQAIVEFGWIGGLAFTSLFAIATWRIWPLAIEIAEARFVLCSLIYLATISLAYGLISRDGLLFLFLGYAARICDRYQAMES